MNYEIKFTPENIESQALFSKNTQDDTSVIERLQLLMGRSNKFKNLKKYFKDDYNLSKEDNLWKALDSNFSKKNIVILNYFINRCMYKQVFRASYQTIANQIKSCRRTVIRAVKYFVEIGLLKKEHPDLMEVCIFEINRQIYSYADSLRYKFESLYRVAILTALNPFKNFVTPFIIKEDVLKRYRSSQVVHEEAINKLPSILLQKLSMKPKKYFCYITPPKQINLSSTLMEITRQLNLSVLGQLRLLIFDERVLKHVWELLKNKIHKSYSKFNRVFNTCYAISQENRIPVDWKTFYSCLSLMKIRDNHKYSFENYDLIHDSIQHDSKNWPEDAFYLPVDPNQNCIIIDEYHIPVIHSSVSVLQIDTFSNPIFKKQEPVIESRRFVDNVIRPYADKKEPNPLFAEFYFKAIENMVK